MTQIRNSLLVVLAVYLTSCGIGKDPLGDMNDVKKDSSRTAGGSTDASKLDLVPQAVGLTPGDEFHFSTSFLDASGKAVVNPPGLTFSSSNPDVLESRGDGLFVAKKIGEAKALASVGEVKGEASVKIDAPAACTALTEFTAGVQPVIDAKCAACHSDNGSKAANGIFPLNAGQDPSVLAANWQAAKGRLNAKDIPSSKILRKVVGEDSHGGGAVLAAVDAEFKGIAKWADAEAKCMNGEVVTALTVTPNASTIHAGTRLQLKAEGKTAAGQIQDLTSAAAWRLERDGKAATIDVASIAADGTITAGSTLGKFSVFAKMGALESSAELTVVPNEEVSSCEAFATYKQNIDPILQASCLKCHGANGVASSAMALFGPAPSDAETQLNHGALLKRLNLSKLDESLVLNKISAKVAHGGGAIVPAGSDDYTKFANWAKGESTCFLASASSLQITPLDPVLEAGETVQLHANVGHPDGTSTAAGQGVEWSLEPAPGTTAVPAGTTVNSDGLVVTTNPGDVVVKAKFGTFVAHASLTVNPVRVVAVSSLKISPAGPLNLSIGSVQQVELAVDYEDGKHTYNPSSAMWSSMNEQVATVRERVIEGTGVGQTQIMVMFGGKSATLNVTVAAPADCPSFATFVEKFQPIVEAKCANCHGNAANPASAAFEMRPATTCAQRYANWVSAKTELDYSSLLQSNLLMKPTGQISHVGGVQLDAAQAGKLREWINVAGSCFKAVPAMESATLADACPKQPVAITLDPLEPSVTVGSTQSVVATVRFDDNSTSTTDASISFASANAAKFTVVRTAAGATLTGVAAGNANLIVKIRDLSVTVPVVVQAAAATLSSLVIDAPTASVGMGQTKDLSLKGNYSDGSVRSLVATAWTTSDATKATVSTSGVVTAKAAGAVTISATFTNAECSNNCTANSAITVIGIKTVTLTPATKALSIGQTQPLAPLVTYLNNTTFVPATTAVTWASSATAKAIVNTAGVVTGKGAGTANITATFNGVVGTAAFTMAMPDNCPSFNTFKAASASVAAIMDSKCKDCHTNSGQGTSAFSFPANATSCAAIAGVWNAAKGKVKNDNPLASLFYTKPAGMVAHTGGHLLTAAQDQIFKDWVTLSATCNAAAVETATTEAVCPKIPTSITIAPGTPEVRIAATITLVATVKYDDGSSSTTQSGIVWSSNNNNFATVDQTGKVTGVAIGTPQIKATLGSISATVNTSVIDASITSLVVVPTTQSVVAGDQATFQLKATYSNNTTRFITTGVTWSSSATTQATITNLGVAKGLVKGSATVSGKVTVCTGITNCPATGTITVLDPVLRSIAISPADTVVTSGLAMQLKVEGTYSDGSKKAVTSGITWTTSDGDQLSLDTLGNIRGLSPGYAVVKASATGVPTVQTGVLVVSSNGCTTVAEYQNKIDPIFQGKCISCHGTGGPGSGYMTLKKATTAFDKLSNWNELRLRLNASNVPASKLLKKITGTSQDGHGGGAIIPYSAVTTSEFGKVNTWATNEAQCIKENIPSNLTRNSGEVLFARMKALFPMAVSTADNDGKPLNPRQFDVYYSTGIDRVLANPERGFSPVVMLALRSKVNAVCQDYVTADDSKSKMFEWASTTLLAGESAPTNAVDKIVLAAARNVWLFPYLNDASEVGKLRTLYNASLAASDALTAKKMVCVAALTAPQFWFGNKGEEDSLRRVYLETLRKVPTIADYVPYRAAANKATYLKSLLDVAANKPSFVGAVKSWHRDWLGLRDYYDIGRGQIRPEAGIGVGAGTTAMGISGVAVADLTDADSGFVKAIALGVDRNSPTSGDYSEACTAGVAQDFDPRTYEVRIEHYNPVSSAWESVGAARKLPDGTWSNVPGSITLANGTKKATSLKDVVLSQQTEIVSGTVKELKQCYKIGGLVGTPLECFNTDRVYVKNAAGAYVVATGKQYMQRRLRRFSAPNKEQNGYSTVKLWFSGEEVRVCNSYSRFAMTCAYRPTASRPPLTGSADPVTGLIPTYSATVPWNFYDGDRPKIGPPQVRDTFASPLVLDAFRCGVPDGDEIALRGTASYNENLAFPMGYTSTTTTINQAALNQVATNPTDFFKRNAVGLDKIIALNTAATARDEDQAAGRLLQDMQAEPLALTEDIVKGNKDYRLLLTADYTVGRTELDLLYRTSDYYLPAYPPGYVARRGAANTPAYIREPQVPDIPIGWLQNSWAGGYGNGLAPTVHLKDEIADGAVSVKPMSGILTQTAFLGPISVNGGKVRSIAARVFSRLLCGLPSEFVQDLDANAVTLHKSMVSTVGTGGKAHVDESRGCYSCHINLDPMSAALKPDFKTKLDGPMYNDLKAAPFLGIPYLYGLRGGKPAGNGAVFGEQVSGIKDLGQTIANTRQFSECVVKTGFVNVFGRQPVGDEMGLIHDVSENFRNNLGFNYQEMIEQLISSDEFRRAN